MSAGSVGLASASLFAVGVLVGLTLYPQESPRVIQASVSPDRIPVTMERFDDAREVELQVVRGSQQHILSPAAGRVTAVRCTVGGFTRSGDSPLAADGVPVVALSTRMPLWRDLTAGMRGADVTSLQEELKNLGYPVRLSGRYDRATRSAVTGVLSRVHRHDVTSGLPLSAVMWLPARQVQISSCDVQLGDPVNVGSSVFTSSARVVGATVKATPTGGVPGRRVLQVDGQQLTLDGRGAVRDPAQLARLVKSGAYALFASSNGAVPLRASWVLADPPMVGTLPAGSLIGGSGTGFCVQTDKVLIPVTVVSSVAGRTLVSFPAGSPPPDTVRASPARDAKCG